MPGFLSSLLAIGGEIIGGPIGGSIGGAIGGAIDQSTASSAATKVQEAAQAQAIAMRQTAANQISTVQAPYTGLGANAANALGSRLGLGAPATNVVPFPTAPGGPPMNVLAPTSGPTSAPGPTPTAANVNALGPLGAAVGAVAAGASAAAPAGPNVQLSDPTAPGGIGTSGQAVAPDPSTVRTGLPTAPATTPNALAPSGAAANPAYAVTNGADPGTFGNTTNPTQPAAYTAPTPFSYGQSDYTASPAYQYQQDQARKATLASASATGALQSGAAMKALQDRAQNIAYTDFTNERGFAANQNQLNVNNALNAYNTNQNVYDNNRDYLTNRFDTQTGNLFRATSVGQTAAGVVSNADMNVANGNATSATAIGNAQATNALTQGNIGSTLANGLVSNLNALAPKAATSTSDPSLLPPMPAAGYGY